MKTDRVGRQRLEIDVWWRKIYMVERDRVQRCEDSEESLEK